MDWTVTISDISDSQLAQALSVAHVPTLMATLMHLQGSCEPLRGNIKPYVEQLAEEEDGLSEAERQAARKMALAAIIAHRDAGCPELPPPDQAMITEAMRYITGVPFPEEQLELMHEELNLFGEDRRKVSIDEQTVPNGYRVLVIGSGMSGILAAIRLHQTWQGDPQAHMGMTIPGFPNLYLLYGPNTNIVVGASIVFFSECEMRYIMGCMKMQFEQSIDSLEVREDVCREYNASIDERNRMRAWGSPHVSSWYKNANGRVSQNWPGTHFEWWRQTREPRPGDFLGH